jgi:hypothetical protein
MVVTLDILQQQSEYDQPDEGERSIYFLLLKAAWAPALKLPYAPYPNSPDLCQCSLCMFYASNSTTPPDEPHTHDARKQKKTPPSCVPLFIVKFLITIVPYPAMPGKVYRETPLYAARVFATYRVLCRLWLLLHEPLHYALVAEHKLAQTLYHAQALQPEVLDCLRNEINVVIIDPAAALDNTLGACLVARVDLRRRSLHGVLRLSLTLEHIQYRVYCTERACPSTPSRTVDDDRASIGWIGLRRRAAVVMSDNRVTLLNQTEEVGGMCWGTEVGPMRVLQLRNLTHACKGFLIVRE